MGKRRGADISHFIAIDKIEDGIITYKNRIIASVIKIDSLNLSLLDYEEQKIKINQLFYIKIIHVYLLQYAMKMQILYLV